MRKHGVAKPVREEGFERAVDVCLVNRPVLLELFRAENQHLVVFKLEVFDDGQGLEGFSQADAVGKDATVVLENLVDGTFDAVALELVKGFPNIRINDPDILVEQAALFLVGEEVFKNVEEGFVVDEFRGVVLVKLSKVKKNLLF